MWKMRSCFAEILTDALMKQRSSCVRQRLVDVQCLCTWTI